MAHAEPSFLFEYHYGINLQNKSHLPVAYKKVEDTAKMIALKLVIIT